MSIVTGAEIPELQRQQKISEKDKIVKNTSKKTKTFSSATEQPKN